MDTFGQFAQAEKIEQRLTGAGAPYALDWAHTVTGSVRRFIYGPKHLGEIFQKIARRGEKDFIISHSRRYTYQEVHSKASVLSHALAKNYDLSYGDRVGIAADNGPEWAIAFFAIVAAGCTPVLLNDYHTSLLSYCFGLVRCKLVISDLHKVKTIRAANYVGSVVAIGKTSEEADPRCNAWFEDLILGTANGLAVDILPDSEALVVFTSGSTGTPKAVSSSHRGVVAGLMNMMLSGAVANASAKRARAPGTTAPCTVVLAPFSHISGYAQLLLAAMLGSKLAPFHGWHAVECLNFVHQEMATSIVGLNTIQTRDLLRLDKAAEKLSSLRSWNVSGIAAQPGLIEEIARTLPTVTIGTGYGLTETNGGICAIAGRDLSENPMASGRVVPTVEIRIVDTAKKSLDHGLSGEIWFRGEMLMSGYCTENNKLVGLENGWFCTGDIGCLTEDRLLFILDRRDEILIFAGKEVSTAEIERFVCSQEGVQDACAVKLTLGDGTDRLVVAIILEDTCEDIVVPELNRKLGVHVEFTQVVSVVVVCDELPRTLSGKINRNETRLKVAPLFDGRVAPRDY